MRATEAHAKACNWPADPPEDHEKNMLCVGAVPVGRDNDGSDPQMYRDLHTGDQGLDDCCLF